MPKTPQLYCSYEDGMFPEALHRRFGENPFDEAFEQQATAIHEAGHAVSALRCGCPYETVEIYMKTVAGTRAWGGRCAPVNEHREKPPTNYGPYYYVHGLISLAGPAAERKYRCASGLPMIKGNDCDHDYFDNVLAKSLETHERSRFAFQRLMWRQAQKFVEIDAVWEAIFALGLWLSDEITQIELCEEGDRELISVSLPWDEVVGIVNSCAVAT